jgi:tctex1 domain-containing protein 2
MQVEPITRLSYKEKVSQTTLKEILKNALDEELTGRKYDHEECGESTKKLADSIRDKLKALGHSRYKFIVQVSIGERREQGVKSGSRCFWDAGTDCQATENFINDNMFASATAYCCYIY